MELQKRVPELRVEQFVVYTKRMTNIPKEVGPPHMQSHLVSTLAQPCSCWSQGCAVCISL